MEIDVDESEEEDGEGGEAIFLKEEEGGRGGGRRERSRSKGVAMSCGKGLRRCSSIRERSSKNGKNGRRRKGCVPWGGDANDRILR